MDQALVEIYAPLTKKKTLSKNGKIQQQFHYNTRIEKNLKKRKEENSDLCVGGCQKKKKRIRVKVFTEMPVE